MANKLPKTVEEQIDLLLERGMLFKNIDNAPHFLKNISYYRLKETIFDNLFRRLVNHKHYGWNQIVVFK